MEVVGDTLAEPLVPLPEKPLVMQEVALVEVQEMVAELPEVMEGGDMERVTVGEVGTEVLGGAPGTPSPLLRAARVAVPTFPSAGVIL